jgi:hypothetical protein
MINFNAIKPLLRIKGEIRRDEKDAELKEKKLSIVNSQIEFLKLAPQE